MLLTSRDLNKPVFDDFDPEACMPVGFNLIAYDSAFDSSEFSVDWSIWQPHDKTDARRELHAPWHAKIETRSAHVVEDTVETERLVIDINAPHARGQGVARA